MAISEEDFKKNLSGNSREIDIFLSSYTIGKSGYLNLMISYGRKYAINYSRFTSEELDKLLEETVSERAQRDLGYKIQAYKKFQEYYMEEIPALPISFSYDTVNS